MQNDLTSMPLILLADDDRDFCGSMARNLESRGYSVARAHTVAETKRRLETGPPCGVVLIDMAMEDDKEAGLKLLQWINERQIQVIPVILTGHGDIRIATESRRLGAFDYLEKGVEGQAETIDNVIRRALRHIQANRSQTEAREHASNDCSQSETPGVTILLADDHGDYVDLVQEFLESNGYTVLSATSFDEALATFAVNHERINLVITDIHLGEPSRTGVELVAKLRETRPALKIIYAAGSLPVSSSGSGTERGAKCFVKPYSLFALLRMLKEELEEERPFAVSPVAAPTNEEGKTA